MRKRGIDRVLLVDTPARALDEPAVVGDDGHIHAERLGNGQRRLEHAPRRNRHRDPRLRRAAHRRDILRRDHIAVRQHRPVQI